MNFFCCWLLLLCWSVVHGAFEDAMFRMEEQEVLCEKGEVLEKDGFYHRVDIHSMTFVMYFACFLPNSTIMTRIVYFPSLAIFHSYYPSYEMYAFSLNDATSTPWKRQIRLFKSCPQYAEDYYASSCDSMDLEGYRHWYRMHPVISRIEVWFPHGMMHYTPASFFELIEESREEKQWRIEEWYREKQEEERREQARLHQLRRCVRDHVYHVPPKYKTSSFLSEGVVFHDLADGPPYPPFFRHEHVLFCDDLEVEVSVTSGQFCWLLWIAFGKVIVGIMIGLTMMWGWWIYEKETCCICLDRIGFSFRQTTSCHHTYHTSCFKEWLKQQRTCPLCRTKIPFSKK